MAHDRLHRLRRARKLALILALAVFSGGAFLGGVYLGSEVGIPAMKRYVRSVIEPSDGSSVPDGAWKALRTSLHEVIVDRIALPASDRTGGAIEQIDGIIVFAMPDGQLGYVAPDGSASLVDARVPMNLEALLDDPIADRRDFDRQYIRVNDMLAIPSGPSRFDLLISHHRYRERCVEFRVSRLTVRTQRGHMEPLSGEADPVFVAEPCIGFRRNAEFVFSGHQAGGRMVRLDDSRVLLSIGDHHFDGTHGMPEPMPPGMPDEHEFPMDPEVDLGKIMLLSPDTRTAEIFAVGVRNPQGLLRDSRGRIWETEHGPEGGDELNLIEAGRNYGWPEVTLGTDYGSLAWPFNAHQGHHDGYTAPRFAWNPSVGIGNLVEADAEQFPNWDSDLLVASLLRMTLFRVRMKGDRVLYVEPLEIGERIRDAIVLEDGRIALYADSARALLIMRRGEGPGQAPVGAGGNPVPGRRERLAASSGPSLAQDSDGAQVFRSHCSSCHSLRPSNGVGPHLQGILGRPIGTVEGYAYSYALRHAKQVWTRRRLAEFIEHPQRLFDGSRMTATRVSEEELSQLLRFLEVQQQAGEAVEH